MGELTKQLDIQTKQITLLTKQVVSLIYNELIQNNSNLKNSENFNKRIVRKIITIVNQNPGITEKTLMTELSSENINLESKDIAKILVILQ